MSDPDDRDPKPRGAEGRPSEGDAAPGGGAPAPEDDRRSPADRMLAPFLEDSTLWGLLIVMAAVLGTFLASILLMAWEGRSFALAAVLGSGWISFDVVRRSRVPGEPLGPAARLILGLWALAGAIAVVARLTGFF